MGTDPTTIARDQAILELISDLVDIVGKVGELNPTVGDELTAAIGDITVLRDRILGVA